MIINLLNWFRSFNQPKLKSSYIIVYGDEVLAVLSDPEILDQFWVSFALKVQTQEPSQLDLLYSIGFWCGPLIVIRESDTGRRVQFMRTFPFDDETEIIDDLKEMPLRINLRGPYKIEKQSN